MFVTPSAHAAKVNPKAHHEESMGRVRAEMRRYADVFDIDASVSGEPAGGLKITDFAKYGMGEGKMVRFSNALVLPAQATPYITDKPYVCVWLESSFGCDAGCPRIELGQGPIYFSLDMDDFETSFADAVEKVRNQMVNANATD